MSRLAAHALAAGVGLVAMGASAEVVLDPAFSDDVVGPGEYAPGLTTDYLVNTSYGDVQGMNALLYFLLFDVGTGESATLVQDTVGPLSSVFLMVNSAGPSLIDGTLRSTVPNADVYLMNPNGLIFGPGAMLDLQGSFYASSANALHLQDGTLLPAAYAPGVSLTAAAPAAWGFLSDSPARIAVDGSRLWVPDGETLSLVGGELEIDGGGRDLDDPTLRAYSGRTELVAVGSSGEVDLTDPDLDVSDFDRLAPITLRNGATIWGAGEDDEQVIVRGQSLDIDAGQIFADHWGPADHPGTSLDVQVRDAIRLRNLGYMESAAVQEFGSPLVGDAGDVRIRAASLEADGSGGLSGVFVGNVCLGATCVEPEGRGGDLFIEVDDLTLRGGAQIFTQSEGPGRGGDIDIVAENVALVQAPGDASDTLIGTFSSGTRIVDATRDAAGGGIHVAADRISAEGGAQIFSNTTGVGDGGDIRVEAGRLSADGRSTANGVQPSGLLSRVSGSGQAGDVVVQARQSIRLSGGAEITSNEVGLGAGRVGLVDLSAPNGLISIAGGGGVPSIVGTKSFSPGPDNPARVRLRADRLEIVDGGVVEMGVRGIGSAGTVDIDARVTRIAGRADSGQPSQISARPIGTAGGEGAGGIIEIDGDFLEIVDGGRISLSSDQSGAAGEVRIGHARPLLSVSMVDGEITSETSRPGAEGGSIDVRALYTSLLAGSVISASNTNVGDAGSISLSGLALGVSGGSVIRTSAEDGGGGDIRIRMAESVSLIDSAITTDVTEGTLIAGDGGRILIDPRGVTLNRSTISANAATGRGGTVRIVAGQFVASTDSGLSATGGDPTLDGPVIVQAPPQDLEKQLARLPSDFIDAADQLAVACEERTRSGGSLIERRHRELEPRPGTRLEGWGDGREETIQ